MAASRALRRLLRVLNLEEEQAKSALESATGELHRLERAVALTIDRGRAGRRLFAASVETGELPDRLAGLEEGRASTRHAKALAPRIAASQSEVETLRQAFLAKRVECRQAETLIQEAEARDVLDASRRAQQGLDSWYLNRLHAAALQSGQSGPDAAILSAADLSEESIAQCMENLSDDLPKPT
jgi:hypothetical protein